MEERKLCPLRYYTNCVSTTQTVLILYDVESVCFFYSNPVHCLAGGLCFAYNCDLYYQSYFPDYDLGWWLFAVTIVVGSIGVVFGGVVSDKFVAKMGIKSRVAVLAISQVSSHCSFAVS